MRQAEFGVFDRTVHLKQLSGAILLFCATAMFALPAFARTGPHDLCLRAAESASRTTGVPLNVLIAIARTESGKSIGGQVQPWPWTINTRGAGDWKKSRSELLDHALTNLAGGETSFDVGCFQINYRWHGDNFNSLDEMIEPTSNARYAADFLRELFSEFGNWTDAAGAYHSRTEVYAQRYKAKFLANLTTETTLSGALVPASSKPKKPRVNTFPLLQSAGGIAGARGSLMPNTTNARGSLLGPELP